VSDESTAVLEGELGRAVAGDAGARQRLLEHTRDRLLGPAPARDPAWLARNGGAVARLAEAIYEGRSLPAGTLDPARLAVLADALEDAGCADPDLLGHLRGPSPHVRGCWAVDLILGKE
jgi:hypothetical protein